MKRRNLLAGIPLVATGLSGCLSRRANEQNDSTDSDEQIDYEKCTEESVSVGDLPSAAEDEVRAAIKDNEYETDGELILAKVVNVEDSYLEDDIDGEPIYYKATVETDNDTTRLFIEKIVPKYRKGGILIRNQTEKDLTVDILIEYDGDLFFEESIDIPTGTTFEIEGESEYRWGDYHADISLPNEQKTPKEEFWWSVDNFQTHPGIYIAPFDREDNNTEVKIFSDEQEDGATSDCSWNDDGELRDDPVEG